MKTFFRIVVLLSVCAFCLIASASPKVPVPRFPAKKVALITDDPAFGKGIMTLFGAKNVLVSANYEIIPAEAEGIIIALKNQTVPAGLREKLERFPGKVLLDLRNFAQLYGLEPCSRPAQKPRTWKLEKETELFAALRPGWVPVRCDDKGETSAVDRAALEKSGGEALVVDAEGKFACAVQKGNLFGCELAGIPEPFVRQIGSFYKYLPATDLFGNRCRFGVYLPKRPTYDELGERMRELARKYPTLRFSELGKASNGKPIYAFSIGEPGTPLYFFYSSVHGGEWEPGYGLLDFAERLARGDYAGKVDLSRCQFLLIPSMNPYGYGKICRKNAHNVDINRQADLHWQEYSRDNNRDGKYDEKDNAWKGTAPWSEPEAVIFKGIVDRNAKELFCILDLHGNHDMLNNLLMVVPEEAREGNLELAKKVRRQVDSALAGRYYLQQNGRGAKQPIPYLFRGEPHVSTPPAPNLKEFAGKGRFGFLVEVCCYFRHTEGTLIATDVTGEVIDAVLDNYRPY